MLDRKTLLAPAITLAALLAACSGGGGDATDTARRAGADSTATKAACAADNGGLTLPAGFCATIFADSVGHARHAVVAANGDLYVNTWSGRYYADEGAKREGGFVVALRDTNRDGRADRIERFGGAAGGNGGGTGIALHKGYVYAEAGPRIVRYRLTEGELAPNVDVKDGEIVVDDFPATGSHPQHNFVIDRSGALYANMGSATNSCQRKDRTTASPGVDPCTELATRAGIWRFHADSLGQRFSARQRYATGIRNAVGLAVGGDGQIWATQHGRDQLAENWGTKFTAEQGQELPSEELLRVTEGADFGWPYCYWDPKQAKRVLAPEYGGDGTQVGRCQPFGTPAATFPAHWAPNDLAFAGTTGLPAKYRGGAFIAFHGSWNRAPGPQGGYNVAFVPLKGDKAGGEHEIFATGFAATDKPDPSSAKYRPAGLAFAPDGALYVMDDRSGRIWRIVAR